MPTTSRGPMRTTVGRKKNTNTAKGKYLRKTTRVGAYNKAAKKNFKNRRAPFVEGKKRLQSVISLGTPATGIPNQSGVNQTTGADEVGTQVDTGIGQPLYTLIPGCWSFMDMKKGLNDDQMIGSSVFSKYLSQKFRIKLPTGRDAIGVNGQSATWFLIHGWVKKSIDLNEYTVPALGNAGRDFINSHINTYVKPYFDNRYDMLSFDTKVDKHIKVIRKLKLKGNRNTDINVTQTGGSAPFSAGAAPEDIYVTCKWVTNRKIHYDIGKPSGDPDDTEFLYPGQTSWIPFSCFYTPTGLTNAVGPQYWQDNCHWFSDS